MSSFLPEPSRRKPMSVPGTTKGKMTKTGKSDPVGQGFKDLSAWVAAEPLTRAPAVGLVCLYIVGVFSTNSSPIVWAVLGSCSAAISYVVGKKNGGEEWGRISAAMCTLGSGWLTTCALTGNALTQPMLLGYSVAATAVWMYWFHSDHVSKRKAWKVSQENWATYAEDIDLAGSTLQKVEETRLGFMLRVDVRGTGKIPNAFMGKTLRAKVAGKHGIPFNRVLTMEDPKHGGMIIISVRVVDPWALELLHPLFDPETDVTKFRQGRTIAMPITIGIDPENDKPLQVELYNSAGGQHVVIVAGSRGGKTTMMNSIIEHITDSPDVVLRMIDISKAKDGRVWAPLCAESAMGEDAIQKAIEMLRASKKRINARSASSTTAVHRPTKAEPANVTIIDEASELLGRKDAYGTEARELVNYIMGKGLSEAEILIIAAQRGVLGHLGTGDVKANTFVRILLGVASTGEMQFIIPDWESRGMPDMSTYGEGAKGVALVAPAGKKWTSGRCFNLSDLNDLRKIVDSRTGQGHKAKATPAEAEATRPRPPKAEATSAEAAGWTQPAKAKATPGPHTHVADIDDPDDVPGAPWLAEAAPAEAARPRPVRPSRMTEAKATTMEAAPTMAKAVTSVEATLAAAEATLAKAGTSAAAESWAKRELAQESLDLKKVVPMKVITGVLEVLTTSGMAGASRKDISAAVGLGKVQTAEWLRVLVNQGHIERYGSGTNTVYLLPMGE